MKLIFCNVCLDIVRLWKDKDRICKCGKAGGRYLQNGLNAEFWGSAIPIGFNNGSFSRALINRPETGDGERFEAFVIPKECKTARRIEIPREVSE